MTQHHLHLVGGKASCDPGEVSSNLVNTAYTITVTNKFFDTETVEQVEFSSIEEAIDFSIEAAGSHFAFDIEVVDHRGGSASLSLDRHGGELVDTKVLLRHHDSGEFFEFATQSETSRFAVSAAVAAVPAADVVAIEASGITEWWDSPAPTWNLPSGWRHSVPGPRRAFRLIEGGAGT